MSSILDALKKVEEESIRSSGLQPRIPQKAGVGDRVRFFFIDRAVVLVLTAGLIGLGAGGFWAYNTFSGAPAETRTASVAEPVPTQTPIVQIPTVQTPDPLPQPAEAPRTAAPESTVPIKEPALAPAEQPARTPEPPAVPQVPEEIPAAAAPPLQAAAPARPSGVSEPEPKPEQVVEETWAVPAPEFPAPEPYAAMDTAADTDPILENANLTLQAISWASRPEGRIAVVNGKICREGERIEGFVIRQINPDDIRVSDGKNTWRLVFRIK